MMTVESRELSQPHNPLRSSSSEGILSSLSPGFSPSLYCSWGFSLSLGSSSPLGSQPLHSFAVSELLAISWACHFWLCSLLSLWHSLFRFPLPSPTRPACLTLPNSPGPTLLARPNSLGPTHSAQFYSLGPAHSTHSSQLNSPGPTHSA